MAHFITDSRELLLLSGNIKSLIDYILYSQSDAAEWEKRSPWC